MRVIAGIAKGHRLKSIPGMNTRPTTDRIKETLFNILTPQIANSRFLDLFAGNGGIGIEALSRGAKSGVFIEKDPRVCAVIKENLKQTRVKGEVYSKDVFLALRILKRKARIFDLIFLDPPYNRGLAIKTLQELGDATLLSEDGLVVVEYGRKEEIPQIVWKLQQVRNEKYGDTQLAFYQVKGDCCEN